MNDEVRPPDEQRAERLIQSEQEVPADYYQQFLLEQQQMMMMYER